MKELFLDLSIIEIVILQVIGFLALILALDYLKGIWSHKGKPRRRWGKKDFY